MKNRFLFIAIVSFFFSCKKVHVIEDLKKEIYGTWELEKKLCAPCNNPVLNFPAGNNNLIIFSPDETFERRNHNTLDFKGSYSVFLSKECNQSFGDKALKIHEGPNPTTLFIQIIGDKLELNTPYCFADGASVTYRRVK